MPIWIPDRHPSMRLDQCPVYLHLHSAEVGTNFGKIYDLTTCSTFGRYYMHRLPMQGQFHIAGRLLRWFHIWDYRFSDDRYLRPFCIRHIRAGGEDQVKWEYKLYICYVAWKGANVRGRSQCNGKNHWQQWIIPVPLHYSEDRHRYQIASQITIFKISLNDYIFGQKW